MRSARARGVVSTALPQNTERWRPPGRREGWRGVSLYLCQCHLLLLFPINRQGKGKSLGGYIIWSGNLSSRGRNAYGPQLCLLIGAKLVVPEAIFPDWSLVRSSAGDLHEGLFVTTRRYPKLVYAAVFRICWTLRERRVYGGSRRKPRTAVREFWSFISVMNNYIKLINVTDFVSQIELV